MLGLGHLGTVTASCLARVGHSVRAWDPDPSQVALLRMGKPLIREPGLGQALRSGIAKGRLRICANREEALRGADIVWITFDTPVDEKDRARRGKVEREILRALPGSKKNALFLLSSQLPVLTTRRLENSRIARRHRRRFAVVPENLRLGQALKVFLRPDRIVVGVRDLRSKKIIQKIFRPITPNILFMGVESAEMTKHAINGFLAISIVFMNEVARICEMTGADAWEVERGLKTESRIGPRAYLRAGSAFAGGTLARDVLYLSQVGRKTCIRPLLLPMIYRANEHHKQWLQNKLLNVLPRLRGRIIAVWGVTYKPGTSTLRRSPSLVLIQWLSRAGAKIRYHDPQAEELPRIPRVCRVGTPLAALEGASALLICTGWPEYRYVPTKNILREKNLRLILDPNGFLGSKDFSGKSLTYHRVGFSDQRKGP